MKNELYAFGAILSITQKILMNYDNTTKENNKVTVFKTMDLVNYLIKENNYYKRCLFTSIEHENTNKERLKNKFYKWISQVHQPKNEQIVFDIIKFLKIKLHNHSKEIKNLQEVRKRIRSCIKYYIDKSSMTTDMKNELIDISNLFKLINDSLLLTYKHKIKLTKLNLSENKIKYYNSKTTYNYVQEKLFKESIHLFEKTFSHNIIESIFPGVNIGIKCYIYLGNIDRNICPIEYAIKELQKKTLKHAVIIGEGGMGKTFSLIQFWKNNLKKLINDSTPIYINLNKSNTLKCKKNFIVNTIINDYLKIKLPSKKDINKIYSFFCIKNTIPSITLLLDGFNEVNDNYELVQELLDISKCSNIQIIITSRYDITKIHSFFEYNKLELIPLTNSQIKKCLFERNIGTKIPHIPNQIMMLIKNPMFLTLYANTCSIISNYSNNEYLNFRKFNSCGEIIWNYLESTLIKKLDQSYEELLFYDFVIKQLFAFIGYTMEQGDSKGKSVFSIDERLIRQYTLYLLKKFNTSEFKECFYYYDCDEISKKIQNLKNMIFFKQILKELHLLEYEHGQYKFIHQYFRDYFSALYVCNDIKFSIMNNVIPKSLSQKPISYDVRRFIGELEELHLNKNNISTEISNDDNISKLLNILRNKFDKRIGYSLWNIIEIIKQVHGNLVRYDFSYLDFSNISLNEVVCSKYNNHDFVGINLSGSKIKDQTFIFQGHTNYVKSITCTNNGRNFITTSDDKTIKIWDSLSFECICTLKGHYNSVNFAKKANNSNIIISTSDDKTIACWKELNSETIIFFRGHTDIVKYVEFNQDETHILSSSYDNTIKIWNIENQECIKTIRGHSGWVNKAIYNSSEKYIISCSADNTIKIWCTEKYECLKTLEGHIMTIKDILISKDSKKIYSASVDGTIKIWDIQQGKCINTLKGHSKPVLNIALNKNENLLISSSVDGTIKIWDIQQGKCSNTLSEHTNVVVGLSYNKKYRKIISSSMDNTIKIWDIDSFKCIKTINNKKNYVRSAEFGKNNNIIITASADNTSKLWDTNKQKYITMLIGHENWVNKSIFTTNNDKIITASSDNTVKIWSLETFNCIKTLQANDSPITNICINPHKNILLSTSLDNTIREWNLISGKSKIVSLNSPYSYRYISYSPDGNKIIAASDDCTVKIWNANTYQVLGVLQGHVHYVRSAVFSPDETNILTASDDYTIKIWNAKTYKEIKTLKGYLDYVRCAIYNYDGTLIFSITSDTVKIWDIQTYTCIRTLKGHSESIRSISLSSDGNKLLTSSYDGTVNIWDTNNFSCIMTLNNISGIYINNSIFKNLHPNSQLSNNFKKILLEYGAIF